MGQTTAEKIFVTHLRDEPFPGAKVLNLDLVFCHEITAPVAICDLQRRGKDMVFDSTRIKAVIDHVTPSKDSKSALQAKILRDWARRHNIKDFFDVGRNGVCHSLFAEKGFIRPGYTVIMGDSHTASYGAFGAFAAGVGTTDLEVGLLKGICVFRDPVTIRINLAGSLPEGVFAKDVILFVIGQIGVNGATDCVIEFHGPIVERMSMESRLTLCNMAIEAGATCGICQPDMITVNYLWPFIRNEFSSTEEAMKEYEKWRADNDAKYVKTINFNLSDLEPQCTFGYKPDCVKPVSEMVGVKVDQVYIGSCTNGSIADLREVAKVLKGRRIADSVRGVVSPGTPQVFRHAIEEGIMGVLLDAGFCVTNPTCGACPGLSNGVLAEGEVCASTTNRNFAGRMGRGGMVHLMSPATAAATAVTGVITDARELL